MTQDLIDRIVKNKQDSIYREYKQELIDGNVKNKQNLADGIVRTNMT